MIKLINIEDQLIVELLKKNPDERKIEDIIKIKEFNYKYFFEMLPRHLIEAEVLSVLIKHNVPENQKYYVSERLKIAIRAVLVNNTLIKSEMLNVINSLKEQGIKSVLMKGLSLNFSGLRVCRDLDLLVRQQDLLTSISILKKVDYKNISNELNLKLNKKEKADISLQFSWNNQYQLYNDKKNILLELHTNLFERGKVYYDNLGPMLDRIDDIWERKIFSGVLGVEVFSNEDILLLMCMHVSIKRGISSNGFLLRNLLDIDRVTRSGIDWVKFFKLVQEMGVPHYIFHSLLFSKELFDTDIPEKVLKRLKDVSGKWEIRLASYHFKCFKNLKYNSPLHSYLYKVMSSYIYNNEKRLFKTLRVVISPLFPSLSRMSRMTGILINSPLLLIGYIINPFRLIVIFLRNLFLRH